MIEVPKWGVCIYVEGILHRESEKARNYLCDQAGPIKFQVQFSYNTDVVNLDKWSCSCRKWDPLSIPCSHAITPIKKREIDPYEFYEDYFDCATYLMTYDNIVHPMRDITQWDSTTGMEVYPPKAKRQARRRVKNIICIEDHHKKQYKYSRCG